MPNTQLLSEIVELGTRLVGARFGALGVLNEKGDALMRFIATGIDDETRAAIGNLPKGRGILGALIRDPRPLRLNDLSQDRRSAGFPRGHPPMSTFLGVPLFGEARVYGNFYFTEKEGGGSFSGADERLAENFARLAVRAIEQPISSEALKRDLDTFRSALADDEAVIITNPAREIILWNQGARILFGYSQEEVMGRRYDDLLVPQDDQAEWRERYVHHYVRRLREGRPIRHQTARRHKDGRMIPVTVALSPVRHGEAGIMAVTIAFKMTKA